MDNDNLTVDDACARVNTARVGSLVGRDGEPLTVRHLTYLQALRNRLALWDRTIANEIDRIDRAEHDRNRERRTAARDAIEVRYQAGKDRD